MTKLQEEEHGLKKEASISDVSTAENSRSPLSEDSETSDTETVELEPGARAIWLRCLHLAIYYSCIILTAVVLGFRSFLSLFVKGQPATQKLSRPHAALSWDLLTGAEDPVRVAREALPVPPDFPMPEKEFSITFSPCANLMIYTGGVACCLQRCPNYHEVKSKLRFRGNSSGAFVASAMAADAEMLEMLPEMLSWTKRFRGRLWGLVGAYSTSITEIVWRIFSKAESFENAKSRLSISVTTFTPLPGRSVMENFKTTEELVTALLGSCYIPVAFEVPQWSPDHGPFWDGGIFEFASQGDAVVSPFESVLPDVCPETPYPKCFSFFPPHEADAVSLFEDGYMDCLRWLQRGAPAQKEAREATFGFENSRQMGPLLSEGKRFLLELFRGHSTPASDMKKCE